MTGGTEFQEAAEAPQKSEEIKESPEKQAEIKEAAEQTQKLDDATLKPAEVVEGGDYKAAESLEQAFVEAVPVRETEVLDVFREVTAGTAAGIPGEEVAGTADVDIDLTSTGQNEDLTSPAGPDMKGSDEISATPINTPVGADMLSKPATDGDPKPPVGADMLSKPATDGDPKPPVGADMLSKPATDGDPKPPVGADMLSKPATDGDPKPPVGVDGITDVLLNDDVLNGIIRIEQQLSDSDQEKSQQASNKFQEHVISSNEPNDYYNLATEAVQEQFGDIEQSESDAQVVVLLSRTSRVIQAELDGINQELNEYDEDMDQSDESLNSIGDDGQLANIDLQNMLQKQQQTIQMLSNISKVLHDTALAVIRKIG